MLTLYILVILVYVTGFLITLRKAFFYLLADIVIDPAKADTEAKLLSMALALIVSSIWPLVLLLLLLAKAFLVAADLFIATPPPSPPPKDKP